MKILAVWPLIICLSTVVSASIKLNKQSGFIKKAQFQESRGLLQSQGLILRKNCNIQVRFSDETISLTDYLNRIAAYNRDAMKIEKMVIADSLCGDAYFLEFTVSGFWNDIQAKVEFYVQTLTQESQERLFTTITSNYSAKGLPQCLLDDMFFTEAPMSFNYHYDPDFTTVAIPVSFKPVPSGYACSGYIERPMTSCWNIEKPYGDLRKY